MKSTWRVALIGGMVLICATVVALLVSRSFDRGVSTAAPAPSVDERIIFMGLDARTSDRFFLDGGSYHGIWSAWGPTPDDPPCTHSVELVAVDPANGTGSGGHVVDLATLVQVPSTGASAEIDVLNVKPGDYYLQVRSACAWQIELSPNS